MGAIGMDRVGEAFGLTTRLLFGKPLLPLSRYEEWLRGRVPSGKVVEPAVGKESVYLPDYGFFRSLPLERVVSFEASEQVSQKSAGGIGEDATLASIASDLKNFAYFVPTFVEGMNADVRDTAVYLSCMSVRDSFDPFTTKKSAYVFSVMDSECLFGAYRTTKSAFLIHCYNCVGVKRCFEMDSAINCADSYFCHNVEDLEHCMFCFNTKAKRYAVGNLEVGRKKYEDVTGFVLERILNELEATGVLSFDIYDILAERKKSNKPSRI